MMLGQQESRNQGKTLGQQEFEAEGSEWGCTHSTADKKRPEQHRRPQSAMHMHRPGLQELTLSMAGSCGHRQESLVRAEYVYRQ